MTTSDSNDSNSRPMAEPGQTREGASTGGILSTAAGGLGNAVQRSSERGDDDAIGRATTGEGVGGGAAPRIDLGGKAAPGSASGGSGPEDAAASEQPATRSDNDSDASSNVDGSVTTAGSGGAPRRNRDAQASTVSGGPSPAADEPPDEGAVESLGRSVSDVVTGSDDETTDNDPLRRRP